MSMATFVKEFSSFMSILTGSAGLCLLAMWFVCGFFVPERIRRQAEQAKTQGEKIHLLGGISRFQNLSQGARKLAVLCGVLLCVCMVIYLRARS